MTSPVVGTAYVRVQTLTANLGRQIASDVERQLRGAQPHIDKASKRVGQRAGDSLASGLASSKFNKAIDTIGKKFDPLTRRITESLQKHTGLFDKVGTTFGNRFSSTFGRALNSNLVRRVLPRMRDGFNSAAEQLFSGTERRILSRIRPAQFFRTGQKLAEQLHEGWNLGIGAARMGPAIISALSLALPSISGGVAALASSLAADLFAGLVATGPGLAGALGVATAGITTAVLNMQLLRLAINADTEALNALQDQWGEFTAALGTPIAESMAPLLSDAVSNLSEKLVPALNDVLRDTGTAFGNIATKLSKTITSSANLKRLQGILATNVTFLNNFGDGLSGLTTSFLILWNAAKPFVDFIGEGIKKFGEWAQKTLEAKEANGELAEFMDGMLEKFQQLWDIISNLAGGLKGVFDAALPTGEKILANVQGIMERFNEWANSDAGQKKLTTFFEKAHELASALYQIFGTIGKALGNAFVNMDTGPLLQVLDIIQNKFIPALSEIFGQISEGAGDNLVKIFDNIGTALQKLADSGAFERVAAAVSGFLVAISEFLASDVGAKILAVVAPLLLFGGFISSLVGPLTTVISLLAAPGLLAAAATIGAIVTAFALVWKNSEKFRDAVGKLVDLLGTKFTEIWDKISPKIERLWDALQKLAAAIGDRLGPVIEALLPIISGAMDKLGRTLEFIIDHITLVVEFFTALINGDWSLAWEKFKEVFANAWQYIQDILGPILSWIGDRISDAWNAILDFFVTWGENIKAQWNDMWNAVGKFFSDWGTNIKAQWDELWTGLKLAAEILWNQITTAIRTAVELVRLWLVEKWEAIKTYIGQVWDGIVRWAQEKWALITGTIRGIVGPVVTWLSERWEEVKATAGRIWDEITTWAREKWEAITGAIREKVQPVVDWLGDRWQDIIAAATTAWNRVVSVAQTVWGWVYDKIIEPIQDAYNWVSDRIGDIVEIVRGGLSTIQGIVADIQDALSFNPSVMPDVADNFGFGSNPSGGRPAAAEGGYVNPMPGGFPITVAEGGRRERIEPLDPNGLSRRDAAMISHIMQSMSASQPSAGGPIYVTVKLGERELNEMVDVRVQQDRDRLAKNLRNGMRRDRL